MPSHTLSLTTAMMVAATPSLAGGLRFEVTLPQIDASPYYRPYLAAWIEDLEAGPRGTVAVWYDTRLKDNLGTTFLRNLRNWWRIEGKDLSMPADGITGPTRPPGKHEILLDGDHPALKDLAAGDYVLAVEVTREDGGREVLRAPFAWGGAANEASAAGESEITALSLAVLPEAP